MRSCAQNCVTVSVMLLSDFDNHRLFSIVQEATDPILQWHIDQNRLCRDSDGCAKWLLSQATGDFMTHVVSIMSKMWKPAAIARCGFLVVHPLDRKVASTLEGTVAAAHDVADMYGQVLTSASVERNKKGGLAPVERLAMGNAEVQGW